MTAGVAVGGGVVASGALLAGAVVRGATVLVWMETLGSGDDDIDADGDAEPDAAGATRLARPKKTTAMMRTVSRLPATAASARSIHRGPRRGGGMILVVSPDMPGCAAHAVPLEERRSARSLGAATRRCAAHPRGEGEGSS